MRSTHQLTTNQLSHSEGQSGQLATTGPSWEDITYLEQNLHCKEWVGTLKKGRNHATLHLGRNQLPLPLPLLWKSIHPWFAKWFPNKNVRKNELIPDELKKKWRKHFVGNLEKIPFLISCWWQNWPIQSFLNSILEFFIFFVQLKISTKNFFKKTNNLLCHNKVTSTTRAPFFSNCYLCNMLMHNFF